MSEESSSTPLRLKPKVKVDGDTAPEASVPPAANLDADQHAGRLRLKPRVAGEVSPALPDVPPPSGLIGTPPGAEAKVRLKPKLSGEALSPASTPDAPPEAPVAAPPPVLFVEEPKAAPQPAIVPPPAAPTGFKLKPKGDQAEPPPLVAPPPLATAPEPPANLPLADVPTSPPPPPKLRVKPSPELVKSFDVDSAASPARRRSRRPLVLVVLLVLVGVAGYLGRDSFLPADPAPEPTPDGQPASLAGQLVEKAEDALAAREGGGSDLSELGIGSRQQGGDPPAGVNDSGVMAQMPARPTPAALPEPVASAAFQRFVAQMVISGVYQGEPARAMINGRTIRQGDMIDPGLGIRFLGVDVERRLVLVQEASGAQAAKKY